MCCSKVAICVRSPGSETEVDGVTVKFNDDEKKFENCVELKLDQPTGGTRTMTAASAMCRNMHKFFICQLNGKSNPHVRGRKIATGRGVPTQSCSTAGRDLQDGRPEAHLACHVLFVFISCVNIVILNVSSYFTTTTML